VPAVYHESKFIFYIDNVFSITRALSNYSEDGMTYDRTEKHGAYFAAVADWVKDSAPKRLWYSFAQKIFFSALSRGVFLARQIPWVN
jgi:hypothetical protein